MALNPTSTPSFSEDEIAARQTEVDAYNKNIAIYQAILSSLNGEWDEDLVKFKGMNPHDAAKDCPLNRIDRLAELQQYEHLSFLIRTEILERTKSQAILDVMLGNK